jgi:biotin operon repressor
MRKQVDDLCNSYRKVLLMPMPRLQDLLRAIDRSDIDELERLWPEVEKELVWAVSERHRAQDDPIGAELARAVDVTSKSVRTKRHPSEAPPSEVSHERHDETAAPGVTGILTALQRDICVEVEKEPMTVKALADRLYKSEDAVKKAIRVLKGRGIVGNKPGRGYYRTDKPPAL